MDPALLVDDAPAVPIDRSTSAWRRLIAHPRELRPSNAAWMLAGITAVSAVLRLAALKFPPALTDEAFTFWRICGSFDQLLDNLRVDAFVPLHYQVVWLLAKWFGPDLWVLRLPSAIAGIAMPYAVYRIGRLVSGRRAGVASAAVAGASAFLGFYARNAKMYMPAWTLLTLAVGSLLCFSTAPKGSSTRRLSWLTFVLFGIAAASTHAVVCIPLAMSPLVALVWARKRRLSNFLLTTVATAIVLSAPVLYYSTFNTWFDRAGGLSGRADTGPAPRDNGLMWIQSWQADRSPRNLLTECLSAYTGGLEWPEDNATLDGPLARRIQRSTQGVMIGLLIFGVIGVSATAFTRRRGVNAAHWVLLLLLVAIPFYGFYLRSFRSLAAPWEMGSMLWAAVLASGVTVFVAGGRHRASWRQRTLRAIAWLMTLMIALTIVWAGARYAYAHAPRLRAGSPQWNPLWLPRYSGFAAPILCVLSGCVIAATPTRVLRYVVGGAVVGLNLWVTVLGLTRDTELPWPTIMSDLLAASHDHQSIVALNWIVFPGQPIAPNLPGPYYGLVRSAHAEVDPPGFRAGDSWPYQTGPEVRRLLSTLRYQSAAMLPMLVRSLHHRSIIVWRRFGDANSLPYELAGWRLTERKQYAIYSVWTWECDYFCDRSVYEKRD